MRVYEAANLAASHDDGAFAQERHKANITTRLTNVRFWG
jgi:hypothetical protein